MRASLSVAWPHKTVKGLARAGSTEIADPAMPPPRPVTGPVVKEPLTPGDAGARAVRDLAHVWSASPSDTIRFHSYHGRNRSPAQARREWTGIEMEPKPDDGKAEIE